MFAYNSTETPPLPSSAPPLPPGSNYSTPHVVPPPPLPVIAPPPPLPPTMMAPPPPVPHIAPPPPIPHVVPPPPLPQMFPPPLPPSNQSDPGRNWLDPVTVGHLEQTGPLLNGPGSRKDSFAHVSGPLSKLNDDQVSGFSKFIQF